MAWAAVPVAAESNVLKAAFDEVRAAIVERALAFGSAATPSTAAADGDQPRALLTNYRAQIESLVPFFANPDSGYAAYTKASCLTAAIGAADWVTNPDGVPQQMYIREINELRLVLNRLEWAMLTPTSITEEQIHTGMADGNSDTSWAHAWFLAKTAYAALVGGAGWTPFAVLLAPRGAGFYTYAFSPGVMGTWQKVIGNERVSDLSFVVANIPVLDTKMGLTTAEYSDSGNIDLYEQTAFGGAATTFSSTPAGFRALDVTTVAPGSAVSYSLCTNPAGPNSDDHQAADLNGASKGWGVLTATTTSLLVKHQFDYRA